MDDDSGYDLVADIGATNARFQLADDEGLVGAPLVLGSAQFEHSEAMLRAALAEFRIDRVGRTLLAVAGPAVAEGGIQVTNTGMLFEADACGAVLGGACRLVNDFFALAHGVPFFQSVVQIGGVAGSAGNKAVLGPGSGLGMAMLIAGAAPSGWRVLASEGGNADLAVGSHLEAELWGTLVHEHGHVSWESVLSGPGLVNLYRAMCAVWGVGADAYDAAEISSRARDMSDPVCHQSLETFCGLLGSAAGNLALTANAFGGVYLGGGIVPRLLDFLGTSPLRRRFDERGKMSELVSRIPLYVITEPAAGLLGAWYCLKAGAD